MIKITVIYGVFISPDLVGSEYEDIMCEKLYRAQNWCMHVCEDHGRILFAFISMCVIGKDMNTPNWSSMTDDTITWEWGTGCLEQGFSMIFLVGHKGPKTVQRQMFEGQMITIALCISMVHGPPFEKAWFRISLLYLWFEPRNFRFWSIVTVLHHTACMKYL